MASKSTKVSVVIPNWNGMDSLADCLDSLLSQSIKARVIVVENGSTDGSLAFMQATYPAVEVLVQEKNLGFAGGVNCGIQKCIADNDDFVALFNNDAVADTTWLQSLVETMEQHAEAGIVTCKFIKSDGSSLDSTGDMYTTWGLPYPRGRGDVVDDRNDTQLEVFGASGGASLYRISMLKEIGLFDEDFFAYYEDVDISFRAQLAGWKVRYVPQALAYHQIGATSAKLKGFTTYQTMKNLPLVVFKNVPRKFLFHIGVRFFAAHVLFFCRAITRGQGWIALKGDAKGTQLLFKNFSVRRRIQKSRKVPDDYIWSILTHDLPPNAHALRRLFGKRS